ncbi:hypothetical protein GLW04_14730 [Halobacillus litoralis]|uniref:Transposase DDE domain-containing protein n=1 Tax=Halobacillus litoralis TaxID=45668 RepID=A0A845DUS3_9BACI|nr:hypothetical protein [Halobacillus litoralis]
MRKEKVERSFADSKERHGLRCCRLRGKERGKEQALITAARRNMKKTALQPVWMSWMKEGLLLPAARKKKACKETGVSLQAESLSVISSLFSFIAALRHPVLGR